MNLATVSTDELKRELFKRESSTKVCRCQRNNVTKEPGRHQPWCDINPAYRPGDWS